MTAVTLNNNNFASWRIWFKARLRTKKLLPYLTWDGLTKQDASGFKLDELDDSRTLGILTVSIDETQYYHVANKFMVSDAYLALERYHEPNTAVDSVALMVEYHQMKWDPRRTHLVTFITQFNDMLRRLTNAGVVSTELMNVTKLFGMMPRDLRVVTHQVMGLPDNSITRQGSLQLTGKITADAALNAEDGGLRRDKFQDTCNKCGKLGHWARECRGGRNTGRGRGRGRRGGRGGRGKTNADKGDANANLAHGPVDYCFSSIVEDEAYSAGGNQSDRHIVLDSGASCHLTGDLQYLHEPTPCSRKVLIASGQRLDVKTKGTMKLPGSNGGHIILENVLYDPSFRHTLVSIPKITTESPNMVVTFEQRQCIVLDKTNPTQTLLVGTYDEGSRLFLANVKPIEAKLETTNLAVMNDEVLMEPTHHEVVLAVKSGGQKVAHARMTLAELTRLWHLRMGHLPVPTMAMCAKSHDGLTEAMDPRQRMCSGCSEAKLSRKPTPKFSSRKWKLGELIHSDLKGPMMSGHAWIKFLKTKDEQDAAFREYTAWLERQTGVKLKCLRSDNGGEYLSVSFTNHLKTLGVTHETSANSFRNGYGHDAPRRYEACATACYIRNRVVNTASPTKTPLELLFGHKPVYKNWRVWGCVAYRLLPYQTKRNKLAAKSSKCIFLGYSETQKAYRVYDIRDRKICVTTEVTFFEDVFHADEVVDDDSESGDSDLELNDYDGDDAEEEEEEKQTTPPMSATERFYGTRQQTATPMSNVQRFYGTGQLQQARMGGNNDSDEDDGVRASRTKSLDMNRIRTPP
ncbi:hypothetical protein Ae201684P_016573 [Aphanomyces euteiches]|nr:hypothetical protein Ae201684P_016573 [Aphanomyces euteiches]